jgi:hypothetical protein
VKKNVGSEILIPKNPRIPIFRALEAAGAKIWLGGALGGALGGSLWGSQQNEHRK